MHSRLILASLASLVVASGQHARAQIVHVPSYPFYGCVQGMNLGNAVSGAGDVNNDGFDDLIIGSFRDNTNGTASGSARVVCGASGAFLYTLFGTPNITRFGFSVSGAGDVDNDGFDDFVIGAESESSPIFLNAGLVRVYSGRTGATLYSFFGDFNGDNLGISVSDAGDVNNDGFPDIIAGGRFFDTANGQDTGAARVFSGRTGAILYTFPGDSPLDDFGISVSGAGDVNNDGFDDLIVGARADDNNGLNSGSARVFSGRTGATLYTFNGDDQGDAFGVSVHAAGDVNNDGFDDVIVGASLDDTNGFNSGTARVFSGATGGILYEFNGAAGSSVGQAVSAAGDVNNDGFDDVIVGASFDDTNGVDTGAARVYSGATGQVLYTFSGTTAGGFFGAAVSGAGDVNNDGIDDFIVGAQLADNNGTDTGTAHVYLSVAPPAPPAPCPGDADGNRTVNFADITSVLNNFNVVCP